MLICQQRVIDVKVTTPQYEGLIKMQYLEDSGPYAEQLGCGSWNPSGEKRPLVPGKNGVARVDLWKFESVEAYLTSIYGVICALPFRAGFMMESDSGEPGWLQQNHL
jgi:hypothetical protein